jgi:hypothetical protein
LISVRSYAVQTNEVWPDADFAYAGLFDVIGLPHTRLQK